MLSSSWTHIDNVYYQPSFGNPIYFEYVSKYRRVIVIGVGNGFELQVSYKGIPVKKWAKNYRVKEDAISWAIVQSENREISFGCMTIKEPIGKRNI